MPTTGQSRSVRIEGQKIADARRKLELDQLALSNDARVSLRSLQRAESGGPISKKILDSIASALKINPEELFTENGPKNEGTSRK